MSSNSNSDNFLLSSLNIFSSSTDISDNDNNNSNFNNLDDVLNFNNNLNNSINSNYNSNYDISTTSLLQAIHSHHRPYCPEWQYYAKCIRSRL